MDADSQTAMPPNTAALCYPFSRIDYSEPTWLSDFPKIAKCALIAVRGVRACDKARSVQLGRS
jgi:hypothetical protein